jgi:hypothetical protein
LSAACEGVCYLLCFEALPFGFGAFCFPALLLRSLRVTFALLVALVLVIPAKCFIAAEGWSSENPVSLPLRTSQRSRNKVHGFPPSRE